MSEHPRGTPSRSEVGHEPSDVNVRGILWFAAGLIVFAVVVHLVLAAMFGALAAREDVRKASTFPLADEAGKTLPPSPRLEGIERKRHTGDSHEAGDYGWVEGQPDRVRIPIKRAMERALSEGRFQSRPGDHRWRGRLDDLPSDASSGRRPWGGQP